MKIVSNSSISHDQGMVDIDSDTIPEIVLSCMSKLIESNLI
jgi:hypothetical protein